MKETDEMRLRAVFCSDQVNTIMIHSGYLRFWLSPSSNFFNEARDFLEVNSASALRKGKHLIYLKRIHQFKCFLSWRRKQKWLPKSLDSSKN
jgi:hypothetical protein